MFVNRILLCKVQVNREKKKRAKSLVDARLSALDISSPQYPDKTVFKSSVFIGLFTLSINIVNVFYDFRCKDSKEDSQQGADQDVRWEMDIQV